MFSGSVGLKPTYGVVSRYGIIAMASSLDSIGHFTRNCTDSRKVFDVTKGIDNKDATLNLSSSLSKSKKPIKIGLAKEYLSQGIDPEVKKTILSAADVFKKIGFVVKFINLPHTKYAISAYYIIQPAEVSSNLSRYDGIRYGFDRDSFSSEAKRRIMLGTYVLSAGYYDKYYLKAMKVRTKIIEDYKKAYKDVDVILAPVSPTPAFKIGEKISDPLKMYLADIFTVSANIAGIPGISIPYGFNKIGLPLGFQLLGPAYSEELLLGLGEAFENETEYIPKTANLI